ncbi:MAG: FAD-dependent monooxygenase, partial [Alphaproteobacteria bacterium]|nr:FAD-dependent monooxygenase [Alphaproteobacteria bacterium]
MKFNTDVLIVGAGPTGLMLACQLSRLGVSFRIIDKQVDRTQESRAFGIQAKSMEIFQNLGIDSDFIKQAQIRNEASFYIKGKLKFKLGFKNIGINDSPFPSLFLLPQSDTEQILSEHLKHQSIFIERQTELVSLIQEAEGIEAHIKKTLLGKTEKILCRYIIGCDGAHST